MWLAIGAISGFLGVAAGAFGAHALEQRLPPDLLGTFQIAVRYHLWHALALAIVGVLARQRPSWALTAAGWAFLLGTVFFSGSLYGLALSGVRALAYLTPIGGVALLLGWLALFAAALRREGPGPPRDRR